MDKLDDIRRRAELRVGVTESSPPFCFKNGTGDIVGYDVDLAHELASALGVPMRKVAILNKQRISALADDLVDVVATGMTRSPARAREVDFTIDTLVSPHRILVRASGGPSSYRDLAGRSLALVHSASVVDELRRDLPTLNIVFYDDYTLAFEGLKAGEVEAFYADGLLLQTYAHRSGDPDAYAFLPDYTDGRTAGLAIKKGEARLLAFANDALQTVETTGRAREIFDAWFAPVERTFRIGAQ